MKTSILALCLLLPFALIAQSNLKPGYVIKTEGDTLKGLCVFPEATKVTVCTFKDTNGNSAEFTPEKIKGFGFTTGDFFQSIPERGEFMELIARGDIDLLTTQGTFVMRADGKLFPFKAESKTIEVQGQSYVKKNKEYIGLLKWAMEKKCPSISSVAERTVLKRSSLLHLFSKYYECTGQSQGISKVKHNYLLSYGVSFYSNSASVQGIPYPTGYPLNHEDLLHYNSTSYGLFFNAQRGKRTSFTLELLYRDFKINSTATTPLVGPGNYVTHAEFRSLRMPILLQYDFARQTNRWVPFINGGLILNYNMSQPKSLSSSGQTTTYNNYFDSVTTDFFLAASLGLKFQPTSSHAGGQFVIRYEKGPGPYYIYGDASNQQILSFGLSLFLRNNHVNH